jgi:hypothetical protein
MVRDQLREIMQEPVTLGVTLVLVLLGEGLEVGCCLTALREGRGDDGGGGGGSDVVGGFDGGESVVLGVLGGRRVSGCAGLEGELRGGIQGGRSVFAGGGR